MPPAARLQQRQQQRHGQQECGSGLLRWWRRLQQPGMVTLCLLLASTTTATASAFVRGGPTSAVRRVGSSRRVVPLSMAASKSTSASAATGPRRRRKEFKTLAGETEYEEIIKKSRFLTRAIPCMNYQDAQAFLAKVSDPKASHNCWAWRGQGEERCSDDGEPSGTAGRPMLAGIESEELYDVMVVITRYFGGIKLGAGGLVRAYGGVTRNCLRAAETVTRVPRAMVRVKAPLALAGAVFQTITRAGGDKVGEDYTPEDVIVDATLEYTGPDFMDELQRLVRDATKGAGSVEEVVEGEEEG